MAEVLVTLGIIGVVSAMTIPSLINNYQRQTYVAQLHKFYNELSQALLQYQTDHNGINLKESGLSSQAALDNFFKDYMKVINDCGTTQTPCLPPNSEYKKMSGVTAQGSGLSHFLTLASGTSFGYSSSSQSSHEVIATIDLDINGAKGPNIVGRDFFVLWVYSNGMIDEYVSGFAPPLPREIREESFNAGCGADNTTWTGCFGKVLNDNWQMTY